MEKHEDTSTPGYRPIVRQLLTRVRTQRVARNWTQAEMARRAGLSRATYQNFEGGYGNPTLENLLRILSVLNLVDRVADLVPPVEEPQTLESIHAMSRSRPRRRANSRREGAQS